MIDPLKITLTRRALTKQLMRAGCPRQEAQAAVERLPHHMQWRKLPQHVQSEIAWAVGTKKPPSTRLEVLTKNALQRRLQDQGNTRSQALRVLKGMPQEDRWQRLPLKTRLQILWKCRREGKAT